MENRKDNYSFIVIPDTQILSRKYPEHFERMVDWIVKSKQEHSIQLVLHVGDVCDNGADDEQQFRFARAQLERITKAGMPFLAVPGNHDYDNLLNRNRDSTMYNRYLGVGFYQKHAWFGGVYEEGKSENMYITVSIEEEPYLVLGLEFGPRDSVVKWAQQIVQAHPAHRVILLTHSFLYIDGERTKQGAKHHPRDYQGIMEANDGEELWNKYFQHCPNLFAVFSGHHVPSNVAFRTDQGLHGNSVFQSFQNWQVTAEGGQGRVRLITLDQAKGKIKFQVYNPAAGHFEREPGYEIERDIPSTN